MRPYRFLRALLFLPLLANAADVIDQNLYAEATTRPATPANFEVVERFGPGGDVELTFSWGHVEDETEIRFIENEDIYHNRRGGWQRIELPSDTIGYSKTVPVSWADRAAYRLKACNALGCSAKAELLLSETPTLATPPVSFSMGPGATKTFNFTWLDGFGETEYRLLESPDNQSGFTEIQTLDADTTSYGLPVFLPTKINASYILEACNANGCTASNEVFVEGNLTGLIGATFGEIPDGGLGQSIARTDDHLAVGMDGAVFVYEAVGPGWNPLDVLFPESVETAGFGASVAFSGSGEFLAVGAPYDDGIAPTESRHQGRVYVYQFTGDSSDPSTVGVSIPSTVDVSRPFERVGLISASNADDYDYFGSSVAIDGHTLVVGARGEDSGGNYYPSTNFIAEIGAVYVFERINGDWQEQTLLMTPMNAQSEFNLGGQFGHSMALDGDQLLVGAPGSDANAGLAYLFVRNEATGSGVWTYQRTFNAGGSPQMGDRFGHAVALAGNAVAVGAPGELSSIGAVYLFLQDELSGEWSAPAHIKAAEVGAYDLFGSSLAFSPSGDALVVGAPQEDGSSKGLNGDPIYNNAYDSGAAYLFATDTGGLWTQRAYIKAPNTASGDRFGHSVALGSDMLVVSAAHTAPIPVPVPVPVPVPNTGPTDTHDSKKDGSKGGSKDGEDEDEGGGEHAVGVGPGAFYTY